MHEKKLGSLVHEAWAEMVKQISLLPIESLTGHAIARRFGGLLAPFHSFSARVLSTSQGHLTEITLDTRNLYHRWMMNVG